MIPLSSTAQDLWTAWADLLVYPSRNLVAATNGNCFLAAADDIATSALTPGLFVICDRVTRSEASVQTLHSALFGAKSDLESASIIRLVNMIRALEAGGLVWLTNSPDCFTPLSLDFCHKDGEASELSEVPTQVIRREYTFRTNGHTVGKCPYYERALHDIGVVKFANGTSWFRAKISSDVPGFNHWFRSLECTSDLDYVAEREHLIQVSYIGRPEDQIVCISGPEIGDRVVQYGNMYAYFSSLLLELSGAIPARSLPVHDVWIQRSEGGIEVNVEARQWSPPIDMEWAPVVAINQSGSAIFTIDQRIALELVQTAGQGGVDFSLGNAWHKADIASVRLDCVHKNAATWAADASDFLRSDQSLDAALRIGLALEANGVLSGPKSIMSNDARSWPGWISELARLGNVVAQGSSHKLSDGRISSGRSSWTFLLNQPSATYGTIANEIVTGQGEWPDFPANVFQLKSHNGSFVVGEDGNGSSVGRRKLYVEVGNVSVWREICSIEPKAAKLQSLFQSEFGISPDFPKYAAWKQGERKGETVFAVYNWLAPTGETVLGVLSRLFGDDDSWNGVAAALVDRERGPEGLLLEDDLWVTQSDGRRSVDFEVESNRCNIARELPAVRIASLAGLESSQILSWGTTMARAVVFRWIFGRAASGTPFHSVYCL